MKPSFFRISITVFLLMSTMLMASFKLMSSQKSEPMLDDLRNFQVNTADMLSSGLPTRVHFETLKANGVRNVIDLLPDDRSEEIKLMNALGLKYHNVAVQWKNPTLENFEEYVATMKSFEATGGITLTHCKLNWRGAVFTYLYRVTQLKEPEAIAKKDLDAIWQPDETWQDFIDEVKAKYMSEGSE
ncbi:MAG: protein tyrosine phosphatase (PTP) superfamily phosphohydrolase (DUF442 family) [Glaciecola sp.]|jgi:protein tyrosine phosphatase (PTP) superfamily phosphohydrolase (DUF442 family)